MSEEAIIEEFGLNTEVNNEEVNQEQEAPETEPAQEKAEFSLSDWEKSHEEKAKSQGWTDLDTFVASGKDPSDWRPAAVFVERGEWLRERKQLRQQVKESNQQFQKRLENVNHLHEQQQAIYISELEGKRDDAIDRGDKEEALRHISDIEEVNKAQFLAAEPVDIEINKAEGLDTLIKGSDDWIYGNDDKAVFAQAKLRSYWEQGMDNEDILAKVKEDAGRVFQDVNHNRTAPATTTTTTAAPRQASSRPLGMADLNDSEKKLWNGGNGLWTNQKQFLQAVQDARKS